MPSADEQALERAHRLAHIPDVLEHGDAGDKVEGLRRQRVVLQAGTDHVQAAGTRAGGERRGGLQAEPVPAGQIELDQELPVCAAHAEPAAGLAGDAPDDLLAASRQLPHLERRTGVGRADGVVGAAVVEVERLRAGARRGVEEAAARALM